MAIPDDKVAGVVAELTQARDGARALFGIDYETVIAPVKADLVRASRELGVDVHLVAYAWRERAKKTPQAPRTFGLLVLAAAAELADEPATAPRIAINDPEASA